MILSKWSGVKLLQVRDATIEFDETIRFKPKVFSKIHRVRRLRDVTASRDVRYEASSERIFVDLDIEGVTIVSYSITLEDAECDSHTKSLEVFSFGKTGDEDVYEVKGDVVKSLPMIFQLIVVEVPLKVVKGGLTQYPKGDGWEVIRKEDYVKEKSKKIDPRLARLKESGLED